MHDLKWLEANFSEAKKLLNKRGVVPSIDQLLTLLKQRRELILGSEELKRQRNEINQQLKTADKSIIDVRREEMRTLAQKIKADDEVLNKVESELSLLALDIPNLPRADVPDGVSEEDNIVVKTVLEKPKFSFTPKDHTELGVLTDTIDMARAAKISGSRFAFLKGDAAKLNRALIQFFCDYHIKKGDTELCPPYMVREQAMIGTGQFPKFMDDAFKVIEEDGEPYYLIPTAEVPVTNFHADEIIDEEKLPLRYCAYSACFRAEAGAAGRDTKGLIRLHQFEKVEMVRFAHPDQAMNELQAMVDRASDMLTQLELPHRVVELCGGDLGFHSEKTFDIEVYLPGQDAYREISSCSSFGSFQARRAKIRMRMKDAKPQPLVTLNGSGLPLGRTIVALFENHQQADGTIRIPKVLQCYMGGQEFIKLK
ncbi:MAG: serine--tRNA ligase [Myxococcales bacterium]|nr:serine--tRNA ligase [Myxococcales bacterium]USN51439.1 MAG: serine--tRNA ligase [Myxococcales bacterium]